MLKRFDALFQLILSKLATIQQYRVVGYGFLLCLSILGCDQSTQQSTNPKQIHNLRIITLSPHLTENVYAAQLEKYLVGTVEYSNHPEAAKSIPRIGNAFSVNKEKLLALKPTHIIAWEDSLSDQLKAFIQELGITLIIDPADTFADIQASLQQLHELHPDKETLNNPATIFSEQQKSLAARYTTSKEPKRIAFIIWNKPLMSIGKPQIITAAIELCGAKNIYDTVNLAAFNLSLEDLITQKPDIIIRQSSNVVLPKALEEFSNATLNNDILARPSGSILAGVESLCQHIHKASTHKKTV